MRNTRNADFVSCIVLLEVITSLSGFELMLPSFSILAVPLTASGLKRLLPISAPILGLSTKNSVVTNFIIKLRNNTRSSLLLSEYFAINEILLTAKYSLYSIAQCEYFAVNEILLPAKYSL